MSIPKDVQDKAQTAFIRARIQLLSTKPFWAHLVLKMPLRWMEDVPGGISCTDGESMFINPDEFIKLSRDEQVVILVHEAAHCAAGHLARCGSRDQMKWNIAGDVYIANMVEADGMHNIALQDTMFKQLGINREAMKSMTTEEIYTKLKLPAQKGGGKGKGKGQPQQGQGSGCGHEHWQAGGCYKKPASQEAASALDSKWKQAVQEAAQLAGNAPGAWSELVKASMPKLPFHLKLFEYLNRGLGGETDWGALNRRYIHQGLYLPTDTKLVMGEIAVAVDTSGSMSAEQLALAFGYIRTFRDQHPCTLHLVQCDYDAVSEGQYKRYDEWDMLPSEFKAIGRGGTSFDPPFKLMREKHIDPKVLIYLTDGYGACSVPKPSYPVLWVILKGDASFKPAFGDICKVE